jgi:hypothetical protein
MKEIPTNIPAIIRGEQRSRRFQYRHSVCGAAYELGVPTSWIWSWLLAKQLKSQTWLRRIWVRLEDVQALFGDRKVVQAAFYATGEPLVSQQAIQRVLNRWPKFPEEMFASQPPRKPVAKVIQISDAKEAV